MMFEITLTDIFLQRILKTKGWLLYMLKAFISQKYVKYYHIISSLIPTYTLLTGLNDCLKIYTYNKICQTQYAACLEMGGLPKNCKSTLRAIQICQNPEDYYSFEEPGIGQVLVVFLVEGAVLFALLLLNEYSLLSKPITLLENIIHKRKATPSEDDDVIAEKQRILNTPIKQLLDENILVLKNVTKYYGKFLAVNSLYLGTRKNECFGLLGVNGAGKTTAFKMMTAEMRMSSGQIWVNGTSIGKSSGLIGYCPQFGGLMDEFTVKETLIIFGLMHGFTWKDSKKLAMQMAEDLDFYQYFTKKTKQLSGGNKRKVNASIALIGDPLILFLDEPTTGMDIVTKRFLWNTLINARDEGKCIILTSHSMEECEALCTRIAIMVNGEFKCLGSVQHLKDKFAAGYFLIIKLKYIDVGSNKIEEFVSSNIANTKLTDKHEELLTYYISDSKIKLSKLFGLLEKAKKSDFNIDDYSIGQGNLEQVFLTLSKFQRYV